LTDEKEKAENFVTLSLLFLTIAVHAYLHNVKLEMRMVRFGIYPKMKKG
jgi:hypothetical protein